MIPLLALLAGMPTLGAGVRVEFVVLDLLGLVLVRQVVELAGRQAEALGDLDIAS